MYTCCPICSQKVLKKTMQLRRVCNECDSKRRLETYLTDSPYRLLKTKNEFLSNLLIDFILFIKESSLKSGQLNRMVIDFIKILQGYEGKVLLIESELVNDYFLKSSIKSPTAIYLIKVFLYSKNLIIFDEISNENSFYPEDIRPERRLKRDVLRYIFSKNRCHDCGKNLTEKTQHNYCYDCIGFRSVYNNTQFDYLNKSFNNESIKGLYINYINYIFSLNRTIQTYANIISDSKKFFLFLQDYIPDGLKMYPFKMISKKESQNFRLIHGNKYINILLSEEWVSDFHKEFSYKNSNKKFFLFYLESLGIIRQRSEDEKIKVLQKVDKFESAFQQPILKLIEFEARKLENLNKKNASLTKSWKTVNINIDVIKAFYEWFKKSYTLSSWAEVTEDIVNKYILSMDFMNGQIRKRTLFNFFTFMKEHGFIFSVPIEQFTARDSMILAKPLSLNQHKAIYNAIEYGNENLSVERFLSSLVYFHGLTSKQIKTLELEDVNLDLRCININGRPSAYLSDSDLILLKKVLNYREEKLGRKKSTKLFPAFKSLKDTSISSDFICEKVKLVTKYSPRTLRIAAFQYCSAEFGSHFLQESFGLSLTQSARYARIGEELLDLQFLGDER